MKLQERFVVAASPERVWKFITDPEQMAPCIPGCSAIKIISPTSYWAGITVKIGPIKADFGFTVEVTDEMPHIYICSVTRGEEGSRASIVTAHNELRLTTLEQGTEVSYTSEVAVTGRLGKFGLGVMKKKAASLAGQFAEAFRRRVETGDEPDSVSRTALA